MGNQPAGTAWDTFKAGAGERRNPGGHVVVTFGNCSNPSVLSWPGCSMKLRAFDLEAGANYVRALFLATPMKKPLALCAGALRNYFRGMGVARSTATEVMLFFGEPSMRRSEYVR